MIGRTVCFERVILVSVSTVLLSAVVILQYHYAGKTGFPRLFGNRDIAIFDLWSFWHMCGGILLASSLSGRLRKYPFVLLSVIIWIAFLWEITEILMEARYFGAGIAHWKGGFEHWANRIIGDPLLAVIGAKIAMRQKNIWRIVFIPTLIWLACNYLSPNSMYIQRLIFGY